MVQRESRGIQDEDEEEMAYGENSVDMDILPTMQVYRGGELVLNWVRVDWEAGEAGITELLKRFLIIFFSGPPWQSLIGANHVHQQAPCHS